MVGLGTVINVGAVAAGGFVGLLGGRRLSEQKQQTFETVCGVSVLFLGIAGAMEGMLSISEGGLTSGKALFLVICLLAGAVIGEIIDIEGLFERFGEWLKKKSGSSGDKRFVEAFCTASFTVCIGAMAIVGSIEDGLYGDYTVLATKSVLDFIIIVVMTGTMGKGCMFSAVPILILQGGVTLLSRVLEPVFTPAALANLSLVGSVLIFCVGLNLVWGKKVRVANLLPALVLAVLAAYI